MKLLVTGGCGFIGVNLIAFLQEQTNHEVVVLDNFVTGKREHLSEFTLEIIEGDIRDKELVGSLMKRVDAVVHLAADTRVIDSIEKPEHNFDVNVLGTFNLLKQARNAGVERFVFASTGGAIAGEVLPPVHEDLPPKPVSPYGASKLCGEAYCSAFSGSYGIKTCSLRFSNVYGPRSFHKGSVVAHFLKRMLSGDTLTVYGDGEQTRDFVHVDDICRAIHLALSRNKGAEVFQLGTGVETSVNHLLRLLKSCVAPKFRFSVEYAPARRGEILRNYCDITRARQQLGYEPHVLLPEGLRSTFQWFLSVGHLGQ